MIYQFEVKHSHGEASGSLEANSPQEAEEQVRELYHDLLFTAVDPETGDAKEERSEVTSVTVTEAA